MQNSYPVETVASAMVQVGDYVYNSHAEQEAFRWVEVRTVTPRDERSVEIETSVFSMVKHPREGIAIRRRIVAELASPTKPPRHTHARPASRQPARDSPVA